jgi:hypothetical protein
VKVAATAFYRRLGPAATAGGLFVALGVCMLLHSVDATQVISWTAFHGINAAAIASAHSTIVCAY